MNKCVEIKKLQKVMVLNPKTIAGLKGGQSNDSIGIVDIDSGITDSGDIIVDVDTF